MMQIPITNQKTKSIRPRSLDASSGSQGRRTATAVAMPPATMPIPSKPRMEPLRIRARSLSKPFPGAQRDPQPKTRLVRYEGDTPRCDYAGPKKGDVTMGLGVGIFLSAVGAILAFAVSKTVSGVNIHTIGWILLIVGILGIVLSMIFWSSWAGPGYWSTAAGARPPSTTAAGRASRLLEPTRHSASDAGAERPPLCVCEPPAAGHPRR